MGNLSRTKPGVQLIFKITLNNYHPPQYFLTSNLEPVAAFSMRMSQSMPLRAGTLSGLGTIVTLKRFELKSIRGIQGRQLKINFRGSKSEGFSPGNLGSDSIDFKTSQK